MKLYNDLETVTFCAFGVLCMIMWYLVYVGPADEARYATLECMGADRSFEAYEQCRR